MFLTLLAAYAATFSLIAGKTAAQPRPKFHLLHHEFDFPFDRLPQNFPSLPSTTHQFIADPASPQTNLSFLVNAINRQQFTTEDKLTAIRITRKLLKGLNPNTRLYTTIHNAQPDRDLAVLERRVRTEPSLSNWQFHAAMREIFSACNDRHFRYIAPRPLRKAAATLGFRVARYYPNGMADREEPRFAVMGVAPGFEARAPPPGADVLAIDGVPTLKAAKALGRAGYGANPSARLTSGTEAIATRLLLFDGAPRQESVLIDFRSSNGTVGQVTARWRYVNLTDPLSLLVAREDPMQGMTAGSPVLSRQLASPQKGTERQITSLLGGELPPGFSRAPIEVVPRLSIFIEASIVTTPRGTFGVLNVKAFPFGPEEMGAEYRRLLKLMPPAGLLVDIRGNLGGRPDSVRLLYGLLSGKRPPKMPITLRATALTEKTFLPFDNASALGLDVEQSLRTALLAGEEYSGPTLDILDLFSEANETEMRGYFGPVVTVMDGRTYSGGDLLGLLQRDTGVSKLIGFDDTTGGGGAGTTTYNFLRLQSPAAFPDELYPGISITTPMLRFYRVGSRAGKLVEAFGVEPDVRYYPTRRDVLQGDADFFLSIAADFNQNA